MMAQDRRTRESVVALPRAARNVRLELEPGRELQLTGVGRAAREGSRGDRATLIDVAVGGCPVDVVEGVEAVGAQLEGDSFPDEEILLNGEIRIEEVRA